MPCNQVISFHHYHESFAEMAVYGEVDPTGRSWDHSFRGWTYFVPESTPSWNRSLVTGGAE